MTSRLLLFSATLLGLGCVTPGPYIRVANASAEELKAAVEKDVVWYEFQQGDVVPFRLGFFGVVEGGADDAMPVKAARPFYLVARKGLPMELSFDGRSFGAHTLQSMIVVLPKPDGPGGQVAWLTYVGESQNPEAELEALLARSSK
jgi:hypothetical protein